MPPTLGFCDDESVNGAPFYVMELRRRPDRARRGGRRALRRGRRAPAIGELVVDTLAAIHAVDPDAVGLGDLGRKEGYVARQLKRWHGQWEQSKTRELPLVDERPRPARRRASPSRARRRSCTATTGSTTDPRADGEVRGGARLGALHARRPARRRRAAAGLLVEPGDELTPLLDAAPTTRGRLPDARRAARRATRERSGRDLAEIDFYVAFGYWKLACILEGVFARYRAGAYGKADEGFAQFEELVARLAGAADEAERR